MPQNVRRNGANPRNVTGGQGSRCGCRRGSLGGYYKRRILSRKTGDKATGGLLRGAHARARITHVHPIAMDYHLRGSTPDSIG